MKNDYFDIHIETRIHNSSHFNVSLEKTRNKDSEQPDSLEYINEISISYIAVERNDIFKFDIGMLYH